MSEIVANLDAAIADYRATHAGIARSIVIFGREWDLVPELTTSTANALAQVVLLAETVDSNDGRNAMGALSAISDILPTVIVDADRESFRDEWIARGVPLGALELIVEAVMTAFSAAPFSQEKLVTANGDDIPEFSADSGNSPTLSGPTLNPPSPVAVTHSVPAPVAAPALVPAAQAFIGAQSSGVAVGE